jgi:hypothetical protein
MNFSIDISNCNGAVPDVILNTLCTVPIATVRAAPFSQPWGASIYAKVIATNIYGDSTTSSTGNGAVILTSPDAPINVGYNSALCSST